MRPPPTEDSGHLGLTGAPTVATQQRHLEPMCGGNVVARDDQSLTEEFRKVLQGAADINEMG